MAFLKKEKKKKPRKGIDFLKQIVERDQARDFEEQKRYEETKAIDAEFLSHLAEQSAKRTKLQESSTASLCQCSYQ